MGSYHVKRRNDSRNVAQHGFDKCPMQNAAKTLSPTGLFKRLSIVFNRDKKPLCYARVMRRERRFFRKIFCHYCEVPSQLLLRST
jgi:hypothetical protein